MEYLGPSAQALFIQNSQQQDLQNPYAKYPIQGAIPFRRGPLALMTDLQEFWWKFRELAKKIS